MIYCRHTLATTKHFYLITGNQVVQQLTRELHASVTTGLRSRTLVPYISKFRLYVSFLVAMGFNSLDSPQSVSLFIEYMAQQGLRAQTLLNYVSVLCYHFFSLYDMDMLNWPEDRWLTILTYHSGPKES